MPLYNDFIIQIKEDNRILSITPDATLIGTQYDNEAQRLVFKRPEKYANMDLILYFALIQQYKVSGAAMAPINIGTENEWILTADITRYPRLQMQIAFQQNGVELEHSNTVPLEFRTSISPQRGPMPSIPSRISDLEDSAFVQVAYADNTLTMTTESGRQESVKFSGSGGYGGLYAFTVREGELILTYDDGTSPPDFHINEGGELIWRN